MRRLRRRKIRAAAPAALLAFVAGWAVTALVIPETGFDAPRWQGTLWLYLGAHGLELSNVYIGGIGLGTVKPLELISEPEFLTFVPILAAGLASGYTCWKLKSSRLRHNVENAVAAGTAYVLVGVVAVIVSDMRPTISGLLIVAVIAGAAVWLGSTFIQAFSGGLPFIGISTFGTVAMVGLLLLLGGVAVVGALWRLLVTTYGAALLVGAVVGLNRELEKRGSKGAGRLPRLSGLADLVEENWLQIIVVTIVLTALVIGLSRNTGVGHSL